MGFHFFTKNAKVQISNQIQNSNTKNANFGIWHSFDIQILTFEIKNLV